MPEPIFRLSDQQKKDIAAARENIRSAKEQADRFAAAGFDVSASLAALADASRKLDALEKAVG